jgi:hypothetical protein
MLPQCTDPLTLSDATARQYARHDGAATCITLLLARGVHPAAMWAGIRKILQGQVDFDPPYTPAGDAQVLAWLLRNLPGPFTAVAAAITGRDIRVEPDHDSEREYRLPGGEAIALAVLDSDALRGWERRGLMMAGALPVARVRLRLVPSRLPGGWDGDDFALIRKGEPCGAVLPGLTRTCQTAITGWPRDPAVTGHAILTTGLRFGFADEDVTADLIRHLEYMNA